MGDGFWLSLLVRFKAASLSFKKLLVQGLSCNPQFLFVIILIGTATKDLCCLGLKIIFQLITSLFVCKMSGKFKIALCMFPRALGDSVPLLASFVQTHKEI